MILRELFVKLGLDVDEASFAKGQLAANLITAGLHKLVEVGIGTAHAFVENAHAAIEYGDKIKKSSQSIGIATDALQELQYAGSLADLSAEEMSQSIGILSRKMLEAKKGSKEAAEAFQGIAFQKDGKLLDTDEVLGNIADKFEHMPDGAEKTAMAMQLFGRAGKQMIPLLNKGSGDLAELREEARSLGLVMGEEAVTESEELNDNLHRLHLITHGLWRQAIAPLIPAISHLVKRFLEWRKENAKILAQRIEKFIGLLVKGMHLLGDAFEFVIKNATAFKILLGAGGIIVGVNALTVAFGRLSMAGVAAALATAKAWLAAAAPFIAIGAIVAGFLLVFDDIRGYLAGEDSLYGTFKNEIDAWTQKKTGIWFVDAMKDFIRYLQEAIEWLRDLDEVFGDGSKARALADRRAAVNQAEIQRRSDNQTLDTARQRLGMGLPLTGAEKAAIKRSGVAEKAFIEQYTPGKKPTPEQPRIPVIKPESRAPVAPAPSNATNINAAPQVNITLPPGSSPQEALGPFKQALDDWWHGIVSPAVSGVAR
jgi:hypothetical protein